MPPTSEDLKAGVNSTFWYERDGIDPTSKSVGSSEFLEGYS
jgi:hypothetical protein